MKIQGRNAVSELLKTDKNIDKILIEKIRRAASTKFLQIGRAHV